MKTYYEVTSTFDNRGRVWAAITGNIKANSCPENSSTSTNTKDIYKDYFPTKKQAEAFVKQTYCA